jgi:hypothetical protein
MDHNEVVVIPWMQEWFMTCKSLTIIILTKTNIKITGSSQQMQNKKAFDKFQHYFIINALIKPGIE